ncbi:MAG: hypothetical protein LBR30_06755 [Clostridioides sp.]|jgi:uncharacterized protein YycO|nr:hypothetical protein [Clostridioides sp.]
MKLKKLVTSTVVIGILLSSLSQTSFANDGYKTVAKEGREITLEERINKDPNMSIEEKWQYQLDEFDKIDEELRKNGVEITEKEIEYENNRAQMPKNYQDMSIEEKWQYQLDEFDKIDEELRENGIEITEKDPNLTRSVTGTYPTRKGAILVTKDGKFGELIGHAGIVYSPSQTVESFPSDGVQARENKWYNKYDKIYGLGVRKTTVSTDEKVAQWCWNKRTKPYNWNFTDVNTVEKFYCSQLVYRGYKAEANINLNYGGGIVYPMDLVNSGETYTSYTKGIN